MASTDQPDPLAQSGLPPGDDRPGLPREALITTAVKFLQNPKVRQSPLATRRVFLKKKGLTDEEVELAILRSGSTEEVLTLSPLGPPQIVPVTHSPPGYRWRDYSAMAVIMVGLAFGLQHLYKKYILPLIVGRREDKQHLQRMESSLAAMSGTLTQTVDQLQQTLASVQQLLVQQQQKMQELSQELTTAGSSSETFRMLDSQTVADLKSEIASLKGLMLSRRQFPATPSMPKIPAWQIPLKTQSISSFPSNHTTTSITPTTSSSSSSDISPVSQESAASSPAKDGRSQSPQDALGGPDGAHVVNGDGGDDGSGVGGGGVGVLGLKDQVRMEVQGEEERKEEEEEEEEEEEVVVVGGVEEEEEEELVIMPTVDRRGGDGQIHEPVDKLRRPEGASNDNEVD
ncbi:unnamed protein product [Merluccius merluccius]